MTGPDESWRVAVLDGEAVVGAGFAVTSHQALTCAHVIKGRRQLGVQLFGRNHPLPVSSVSAVPSYRAGNENADVAVVDVAGGARTVAPLGSLSMPAAGAVVTLIGLPEHREREGRRTVGVVMGLDRSGEWLQIDALNSHGAWVEPGFSGGAAVDQSSGLVVGMVVRTNRNPAVRNAWLIPLPSIAAYWPPLAALASSRLAADADFRDFRAAFESRRYADALTSLSAVQRRLPDESDIYYYWALAALGGWRPSAHAGETVDAVLRLLCEADRREPGAVHVGVLAAVICEDYFVLRHLPPPHLPMTRLPRAVDLDEARAREIIDHVPAMDCATWRTIMDRSRA